MPKYGKRIKRAAKKKRHHPYGNDADAQMDVDMEMENSVPAVGATRGKILQRHKREWRELRKEIQKMHKDRQRLNKKDPSQKAEQKEITRKIRDIRSKMDETHAAELACFDKLKQAAMKAGGKAMKPFIPAREPSNRSRKKRAFVARARKAGKRRSENRSKKPKATPSTGDTFKFELTPVCLPNSGDMNMMQLD